MTTLAFRDVPIDLTVDGDEGLGHWLREFLWPMFENDRTNASSPERSSVTFTASSVPAIDPQMGTTAGYAHSRVVFALDAEPMRALEAPLADGVRLWTPAPTGIAIDITADRTHVRLRRAGTALETRARAMRVVREYAHNGALASGDVVFHAACVAVNGRAIAIAGPKRAGKTTLMLALLTTQDVELVANDRTLVRLGRDLAASAMPTVISLRRGTRELFPALTARLSTMGDFQMLDRERQSLGPRPPESLDDVWHFSHRQLSQAAGRRLRDLAPVDTFLFPDPDMPTTGQIRRLTDDEAAASLTGAVLGARHGAYTSDYFRTGNQRSVTHEDVAARCRAFAPRVRCFAVPWTTSRETRRILDACVAS